MAHLDEAKCVYEKKKVGLNETSALIKRHFKSPGEREAGGPSGPYVHYEPDGPTCGGSANRPTVGVNTGAHTQMEAEAGVQEQLLNFLNVCSSHRFTSRLSLLLSACSSSSLLIILVSFKLGVFG